MRMGLGFIHAVKKAGVEVYYADRSITKVWNSSSARDKKTEPLRYGGWYWMRSKKGRVIATDEDGPFKSQSAAIRDAYVKLQLRTQ